MSDKQESTVDINLTPDAEFTHNPAEAQSDILIDSQQSVGKKVEVKPYDFAPVSHWII